MILTEQKFINYYEWYSTIKGPENPSPLLDCLWYVQIFYIGPAEMN
jgi:hypothetical protein